MVNEGQGEGHFWLEYLVTRRRFDNCRALPAGQLDEPKLLSMIFEQRFAVILWILLLPAPFSCIKYCFITGSCAPECIIMSNYRGNHRMHVLFSLTPRMHAL